MCFSREVLWSRFVTARVRTTAQRKHSRSTSQPEVHANLETLALDAEVNGALRGMERAGSLRGVDPNASRMAQRKYLHEEISLLWTICNSSSRDAVFSNSW